MKTEMFETPEKYKKSRQGSPVAGVFLIILGGVFLLGVSGVTLLGFSPWLLMAFVPVYWLGAAAYKQYKAAGRVTVQVIVTLLFSLMPFAYVGAAVLGLNVAALWPIGLIAVGASLLLLGGKE